MKITKPCVDSNYMLSKRFTLTDGHWTRVDKFSYLSFEGVKVGVRTLKIWIDDVIHPEFGTNIEIRVNDDLIGSGYWTDREDFLSLFTL